MATETVTVEQQVAALSEINRKQLEQISDLKETVAELREEVEGFDEGELVKGLELYADPHNWTPDGKFSPLMKHIDADDPYDPASRALAAYRG